ncbi:MAG: synthase delta subunit [Pseudomonadota bacterium]|jgi:F-type H+-transporting ATPase subunit delta
MAANVSIARRYARALIDVASSSSSLDAVGTELSALADALGQNRELNDVMVNPAYPVADRLAVVEKLVSTFKLSAATANLLKLLVERNRMGFLPDIQRLYADLADARVGRVRATVTSAVPLDPATLGALEASLAKVAAKSVVLESKVDASLLGGVTATVGSLMLDGSVKTQLEQLRRELRGSP